MADSPGRADLSTEGAGTQDSALAPEPEGVDLPVVARRVHPGRWVGAALTGLLLLWLAYTIIINPNLHWDVVVQYQFAPAILSGLWVTIQLTVISMVVGVLIGIVVAIMELSQNVVLRSGARLYIWFFRGTPLLVQLIFWFNLGLIFPEIVIGLPLGGPDLISWETNELITSFTAGLLGLTINEGAYMSQIVRSGIQSVHPGQRQAAMSLGMSSRQVFTRVILPQAMRVIIPPTGNQFIAMLKTSSLVAVIAGSDLMTVAQHIYLKNFEVIALLIVACLWYLVLTTLASIAQHYVERHYSRGYAESPRLSRRIKKNLQPRTTERQA